MIVANLALILPFLLFVNGYVQRPVLRQSVSRSNCLQIPSTDWIHGSDVSSSGLYITYNQFMFPNDICSVVYNCVAIPVKYNGDFDSMPPDFLGIGCACKTGIVALYGSSLIRQDLISGPCDFDSCDEKGIIYNFSSVAVSLIYSEYYETRYTQRLLLNISTNATFNTTSSEFLQITSIFIRYNNLDLDSIQLVSVNNMCGVSSALSSFNVRTTDGIQINLASFELVRNFVILASLNNNTTPPNNIVPIVVTGQFGPSQACLCYYTSLSKVCSLHLHPFGNPCQDCVGFVRTGQAQSGYIDVTYDKRISEGIQITGRLIRVTLDSNFATLVVTNTIVWAIGYPSIRLIESNREITSPREFRIVQPKPVYVNERISYIGAAIHVQGTFVFIGSQTTVTSFIYDAAQQCYTSLLSRFDNRDQLLLLLNRNQTNINVLPCAIDEFISLKATPYFQCSLTGSNNYTSSTCFSQQMSGGLFAPIKTILFQPTIKNQYGYVWVGGKRGENGLSVSYVTYNRCTKIIQPDLFVIATPQSVTPIIKTRECFVAHSKFQSILHGSAIIVRPSGIVTMAQRPSMCLVQNFCSVLLQTANASTFVLSRSVNPLQTDSLGVNCYSSDSSVNNIYFTSSAISMNQLYSSFADNIFSLVVDCSTMQSLIFAQLAKVSIPIITNFVGMSGPTSITHFVSINFTQYNEQLSAYFSADQHISMLLGFTNIELTSGVSRILSCDSYLMQQELDTPLTSYSDGQFFTLPKKYITKKCKTIIIRFQLNFRNNSHVDDYMTAAKVSPASIISSIFVETSACPSFLELSTGTIDQRCRFSAVSIQQGSLLIPTESPLIIYSSSPLLITTNDDALCTVQKYHALTIQRLFELRNTSIDELATGNIGCANPWNILASLNIALPSRPSDLVGCDTDPLFLSETTTSLYWPRSIVCDPKSGARISICNITSSFQCNSQRKDWQVANGCFRCGLSPSYIKYQAPTFATFDIFPRIDIPISTNGAMWFFDSMISYCMGMNKPTLVNSTFPKIIIVLDDSCDTGLRCASFILSRNTTIDTVSFSSVFNTVIKYNCIASSKMIQIYQVLNYPLFLDNIETNSTIVAESNSRQTIIAAFSLSGNSSVRSCQAKSVCSLHGIQEKVFVPTIAKSFPTIDFDSIQTEFAFVTVSAAYPSVVTGTDTILHLDRDVDTVCRKKRMDPSTTTCYNNTNDEGGEDLMRDPLKSLLSFNIYNFTTQSYFGNYTSPFHIISRLDKAMNLYIEAQGFTLPQVPSQHPRDASFMCPFPNQCWMGSDTSQGFDYDGLFTQHPIGTMIANASCFRYIFSDASLRFSPGNTIYPATLDDVRKLQIYSNISDTFATPDECFDNATAYSLVPNTPLPLGRALFVLKTYQANLYRVNDSIAREVISSTTAFCDGNLTNTTNEDYLINNYRIPLSLTMPNQNNERVFFTEGMLLKQSFVPPCSAERILRHQYPYNIKYPMMYLPIIYAYALMTHSQQLRQLVDTLDLFLCEDKATNSDVWLNDLVTMTLDCHGMENLHAMETPTTLPFCHLNGENQFISTNSIGSLCEYAASFMARSNEYYCLNTKNSKTENATFDADAIHLQDVNNDFTITTFDDIKKFNGYNSSEVARLCPFLNETQYNQDINNFFNTTYSDQKRWNPMLVTSLLSPILSGEFLYVGIPDNKCNSLTRCVKYPNPLLNRSNFQKSDYIEGDFTDLFGEQTVLNQFRKTMIMLFDRMFEMNEPNMTYDGLVNLLFPNRSTTAFSLFPSPQTVVSSIDSYFALRDGGCLARPPDDISASVVNMDVIREFDRVNFTVVTRDDDIVVTTASLTFVEDLPN